MTLYDPWRDASAIAASLRHPDARLVVVIGAEAWCEKCRTLRPEFDAFAQHLQAGGHVALWMDIEEHGEFLGDYVPEDMPALFCYRDRRLASAGIVAEFHGDTWTYKSALVQTGDLPDLWAALMAENWAD